MKYIPGRWHFHTLLSTGNCKISDFSEKDNLGGFKIEFFSRPTVNLILDFAYELIGQG